MAWWKWYQHSFPFETLEVWYYVPRWVSMFLSIRSMNRMSPESLTHFPQSAPADGKLGPCAMPVTIRIAISSVPLGSIRTASGVNSVRTPEINTPPPKIHLLPIFSARNPIETQFVPSRHSTRNSFVVTSSSETKIKSVKGMRQTNSEELFTLEWWYNRRKMRQEWFLAGLVANWIRVPTQWKINEESRRHVDTYGLWRWRITLLYWTGFDRLIRFIFRLNLNEGEWLAKGDILNSPTMATIPTDKFTRIAYRQKKPKKAHAARACRACILAHFEEFDFGGSTL